MRTSKEFNEKYKDYLDSKSGMLLDIPSVLSYVDQVFTDLTWIPGFKYEEITTRPVSYTHLTLPTKRIV